MKIIDQLSPFTLFQSKRKKLQNKKIQLVNKYLRGLNGIEIGGSGRSFGLANQKGSYAYVDIIDAETRAKSKDGKNHSWSTSWLLEMTYP